MYKGHVSNLQYPDDAMEQKDLHSAYIYTFTCTCHYDILINNNYTYKICLGVRKMDCNKIHAENGSHGIRLNIIILLYNYNTPTSAISDL